jgi:3-deoxy-D-manno-octulosonic-acid transferase
VSAGVRLWSFLVEAGRPLLPLMALGSPKMARAVAARRGAAARLADWAAASRDPSLPALWVHGASAGELLGAAPAIELLRARRPLQLVVTYFSPSGEAAVPVLSPDDFEALPLDTLRETGRALDAVRPDALVFAKLDLWPSLVASTAGRGIPLGLVNGTVSPGSSRLRWPARFLLAGTYRRLDRVGAVSPDDAARLRALGVREEALTITGDAAFDRAAARIRQGRSPDSAASRLRAALGLADGEGRPLVLLGGSTWPPDEELLLAATSAAREAGREVALVLAPHEPDRAALDRLAEASLRVLGCRPRPWPGRQGASGVAGGLPGAPDAGAGASSAPLVVDRVGLLAELYAVADVAYVGGGLGPDGLHSVVEPAAAGIPVLFGPRHTRREAAELLERGGALEVDPDSAADTLARLAADPAERARLGRAALAYVEEGCGAAARTADLIEALLAGSRGGAEPPAGE